MTQITTLYVVAGTIGGFAREDASEVSVKGVFTDKPMAEKVALVSHGKVFPVELDNIMPGYLQAFEAFGIKLDNPADQPAS